MKTLDQLKVRIFADGADKNGMLEVYRHPHVKGFTTNPTLMRKAGIVDYEAFAKDILSVIPDRSISFEVFADDFAEIESAPAKNYALRLGGGLHTALQYRHLARSYPV